MGYNYVRTASVDSLFKSGFFATKLEKNLMMSVMLDEKFILGIQMGITDILLRNQLDDLGSLILMGKKASEASEASFLQWFRDFAALHFPDTPVYLYYTDRLEYEIPRKFTGELLATATDKDLEHSTELNTSPASIAKLSQLHQEK